MKEKVGRPRKEEAGKKDLEILKRLGLKGPLNRHQISREGPRVVISYPTVWRRLEADRDSLLNEGYVSKGTEPGTYTLTSEGLSRLVAQYSESLGSQVSQVVERWSSSVPSPPYLFKKWGYLKERGLEDGAIEVLKAYWPLPDNIRRLKFEDAENQLARILRVVKFTYLFGALGPEITLRWCKAIHDDPELKMWTIGELKDEINVIDILAEFFTQLLQVIEGPEEPKLDDIKSIAKNFKSASTLALGHWNTALAILIMVHLIEVHRKPNLTAQGSE
jgi:hypothetical protein